MTALYFARYLVIALLLTAAVAFAWWSASEDR
jgi:hypothetical protein